MFKEKYLIAKLEMQEKKIDEISKKIDRILVLSKAKRVKEAEDV